MEGMDASAQTFTSPHRPMGWFGLAMVVALLAITFLDGSSDGHLAFASGVLLFGAIVVMVYLRPMLVLHGDHLLVRNALSDVTVPWNRIEAIDLRQVLEVDVGDRVVRALAFGRTIRQQRRSAKAGAKASDAGLGEVDYTTFVVDRLRNVAQSHGGLRTGAGDAAELEQSWRWSDITVLAVLGLVTASLVLLA